MGQHHPLLESSTRENKAGQSIHEILLNTLTTCLIMPKNLGIRVNPFTGKVSTIDLTFSSLEVANAATIKLGPHTGSNHLPVVLTINASPARRSGNINT